MDVSQLMDIYDNHNNFGDPLIFHRALTVGQILQSSNNLFKKQPLNSHYVSLVDLIEDVHVQSPGITNVSSMVFKYCTRSECSRAFTF